MDEFGLIRRYFAIPAVERKDVVLGIGDDAALLRVPLDHELAVSTDSLIAGVHFPDDFAADAVAHRALAANLSDLAAMGATPAWALLALTLPEADEEWLEDFSRGFFALARQERVALVGGNIARGPLNVTITVHGFVPRGMALTRRGAEPGDLIYVTGHPGDAAAGFELLQRGEAPPEHPCVRRFTHPLPRLAAGEVLRGIASAAIDISDGLLADLGHLLDLRNFGAKLALERLPLSAGLQQLYSRDEGWRLALTGGDDYELCFTVPASRAALAEARLGGVGCPVACVGAVEPIAGIQCVDGKGGVRTFPLPGYRHF